ncbi:MAG: type II toxin-antitoxin system prevent-host-death family antitoxin [Thermoanaerobaculia bacterium]
MSKTVALADVDLPALLEEIVATKEEVVITKNGAPVVRVLPAVEKKPMTIEEIRKAVLHVGDVESPVLEWDPERW